MGEGTVRRLKLAAVGVFGLFVLFGAKPTVGLIADLMSPHFGYCRLSRISSESQARSFVTILWKEKLHKEDMHTDNINSILIQTETNARFYISYKWSVIPFEKLWHASFEIFSPAYFSFGVTFNECGEIRKIARV